MNSSLQNEDFSLDALRSGDKTEFARLVDAFSKPIYNLALRILNDPLDAEDILQETFIKAYRSLPNFEGRSSLSTWLHRIAVNEALMMVRQRAPDTLSIEQDNGQDDDQSEPIQVVDWCCLPEQELLSGEAQHFLDRAIKRLPSNLRVVFVLRDIEGLSIKETVDALGLSETAVKTRLLRARLNLRDQLSSYYGDRMKEKKGL